MNVQEQTNGSDSVSGTGHKKKRDWKVVNARRKLAQAAKGMDVSRYMFDQARKLRQLGGEDLSQAVVNGELKMTDALRIAYERILAGCTPEQVRNYYVTLEQRKIRKHWKCIVKSVREICRLDDCDIDPEKMAFLLLRDDKFMGRTTTNESDVSGT